MFSFMWISGMVKQPGYPEAFRVGEYPSWSHEVRNLYIANLILKSLKKGTEVPQRFSSVGYCKERNARNSVMLPGQSLSLRSDHLFLWHDARWLCNPWECLFLYGSYWKKKLPPKPHLLFHLSWKEWFSPLITLWGSHITGLKCSWSYSWGKATIIQHTIEDSIIYTAGDSVSKE